VLVTGLVSAAERWWEHRRTPLPGARRTEVPAGV